MLTPFLESALRISEKKEREKKKDEDGFLLFILGFF